jgi:serine protease Do
MGKHRQRPARTIAATCFWFIVFVAVVAGLAKFAPGIEERANPMRSVVMLKAEHVTGSGFVVSPGLILTANHVAAAMTDGVTITDYDGKETKGKVVWLAPEYDVALIEDKEVTGPVLPLNCKAVGQGDHVSALGHPFGIAFVRTEGQIASRAEHVDENFKNGMILADMTVAPGMSGGPVIKNGAVIGMSDAVLTAQGAAFPLAALVPSTQLCRLLARNT